MAKTGGKTGGGGGNQLATDGSSSPPRLPPISHKCTTPIVHSTTVLLLVVPIDKPSRISQEPVARGKPDLVNDNLFQLLFVLINCLSNGGSGYACYLRQFIFRGEKGKKKKRVRVRKMEEYMFREFLDECREVTEKTSYLEIFNYSVSGREKGRWRERGGGPEPEASARLGSA